MRKHSIPFVVALGLAVGSAALIAVFSAHAETCTPVEVHNVRPDQGVLMVAAYADAGAFNKTPVSALQVRAGSAATATFSLCGLPGPNVAVMLYQDLNGNGKLDTSVLGIPSEPWGASGKPAAFSAPTWETTNVVLDGAPIVIKLSQ
jgi:uncharacterized protein (DUF2141 family)